MAEPVTKAVLIATGIFSFFGSRSRRDAKKRAYRRNIQLLQDQKIQVERNLITGSQNIDYSSDIVEGQQKSVLQSLGVKGTGSLSKGLIRETQAQAERRKGDLEFEADLLDKRIDAKIAEQRAGLRGNTGFSALVVDILNSVTTTASLSRSLNTLTSTFTEIPKLEVVATQPKPPPLYEPQDFNDALEGGSFFDRGDTVLQARPGLLTDEALVVDEPILEPPGGN